MKEPTILVLIISISSISYADTGCVRVDDKLLCPRPEPQPSGTSTGGCGTNSACKPGNLKPGNSEIFQNSDKKESYRNQDRREPIMTVPSRPSR